MYTYDVSKKYLKQRMEELKEIEGVNPSKLDTCIQLVDKSNEIHLSDIIHCLYDSNISLDTIITFLRGVLFTSYDQLEPSVETVAIRDLSERVSRFVKKLSKTHPG